MSATNKETTKRNQTTQKKGEIINIEEKEDKVLKKEKQKKQKNKKSNDQKSKEPCNGIFINGIPYETTEDELKELFSPFGEIEQIKLPKYQDSGRNIGYCHIYYTSVDSAN